MCIIIHFRMTCEKKLFLAHMFWKILCFMFFNVSVGQFCLHLEFFCKTRINKCTETSRKKKKHFCAVILLYKVVRFICLKLQIAITTELIGFSLRGKLYIGPQLVLGFFRAPFSPLLRQRLSMLGALSLVKYEMHQKDKIIV